MKFQKHVVFLAGIAVIAAACAPTVIGAPGRRGRSRDVVVVGNRASGPGARGIRIPPGHYPPPGHCRLWIAGRPPGHQPPPVRCGSFARRVPAGAFILYDSRAWDTDYDWRAYERQHPGSVPKSILKLLDGRGRGRRH